MILYLVRVYPVYNRQSSALLEQHGCEHGIFTVGQTASNNELFVLVKQSYEFDRNHNTKGLETGISSNVEAVIFCLVYLVY